MTPRKKLDIFTPIKHFDCDQLTIGYNCGKVIGNNTAVYQGI